MHLFRRPGFILLPVALAVMVLIGLGSDTRSVKLRSATPPTSTTQVEVIDVPRQPAPTTTTTTTTIPPTTTTSTTVPPTTAPPPPPEPEPAPAPAAEPGPVEVAPPAPEPATDLWSTYQRCSRGYGTGIEVIPGVTSSTTWDRVIQVSEYHAYSVSAHKQCWVLAHEDGHAYGRTLDPNGWTPPAWPYGVERFADCYAEAVVGSQYGSCPDMGLARSIM